MDRFSRTFDNGNLIEITTYQTDDVSIGIGSEEGKTTFSMIKWSDLGGPEMEDEEFLISYLDLDTGVEFLEEGLKLLQKRREMRMAPRRYAVLHLFELDHVDEATLLDDLEKKYPGFCAQLRRGDMINNICDDQYRSQGSYLIDLDDGGRYKVVLRDTEYDEYGAPSDCFLGITEFPLDYWDWNGGTEGMTENQGWVGSDRANDNNFCWSCDSVPVKVNLDRLGLLDLDLIPLEGNHSWRYQIFQYNGTKYLLLCDDEDDLTRLMKFKWIYPSSCYSTRCQMQAIQKLMKEHRISTDHLVCNFL